MLACSEFSEEKKVFWNNPFQNNVRFKLND
uniref:Uncharacterized protein n=1 Tax=Anguilla anguilla TaxID=7936 RepID=A0A0E9S8Q1_ANGAN